MRYDFTKMHGLGNDVIVLDAAAHGGLPLSRAQWRTLGDRHRGIGFDQAMVLEPPRSPDALAYYRVFNADGVCCYGTNTNLEELQPDQMHGEGVVIFQIESLKLVEGTYRLDLAVHKLDGYPYDYHRLLYSFRVKSRTKDVGIYRPDHQWTFSPNIRFKAGDRPRGQE